MEYYLELSMVNFRCWERKTFKFDQGITLLSAASGKGKSTICEAIYWALYGTLKNVSSKDYVKKETLVTLILYSNNLKCKITRIRPQNLTVELLINNEIKVLQKHDGQNWINDTFGSSNVFIASSYLSQGTRHFLMTSSSLERMNLLKEITFGDDSEKNSPDYYLNKLKGEINSLSLLINGKCNSKSSCQEIINQFYQKNKDYLVYGLIDKNTNINDLKIKEDILKNIDIYTKLFYQNQQSKIILNKINNLNYIEFNQYQLLEDYKNFLEYDSLSKELSFFNEKVLTIDNDVLINDKYLYSKYFSVGYNEKEDIIIFLNNKKIHYEKYNTFISILKENEIISKTNKREEQIYNKQLNEYNNYISSSKLYKELEEDLLSFLSNKFNGEKIEDITYPSLEKDQYLYSQYIKHGYNINEYILLFIENVKEQHSNYKIFIENEQKNRDISNENNKNREINQIREKQYNEEFKKYNTYLSELEKYNVEINKIEVCNKINDDDDLSIDFLRNLIEKSTNLLCDLYCPHCNKGLFLQDNKLNKGSISIDEKDNILLILIDAKEELNKRIKNEKLEKIYKPTNVELPNKNESIDLLPLIDNKHVDKPILSLFEIPILSFQEINNIILLKEEYSKILYKPKNVELPNKIKMIELLSLIDNKHVNKPILSLFEIPILSCQEINNIILLKEKYSKMYKPKNVELPNTIILNKILPLIQNKHVNKPILNIFEIPILSFQEINNILIIKEKYSKLSKIIRYNVVDKPDNINGFIPIDLKPYVKIDKYDLDIFEIPSLSYVDICSIEKSKPYIQKYHIMKQYNGKKYNNAKEYYNQLVNEKNVYEKKKIEYDLLNKQLSELPKINDNIEDYINKLNNDLKLIIHRIDSFQFANDYNNLIITFNNIENDIMTMVNKNNNLNKIYKTISELSSKYLEEIIDDINSSLKLILDELFDKSIDVKLSTHKILKNGTEKLDINLEVFFGDMNYDNLNFLSGGEKDRISLALLLSFSKMKNQNIIILDEVCASLNDELRDKVLDIINEWNKDKIIINICHGISKGMHENIINI